MSTNNDLPDNPFVAIHPNNRWRPDVNLLTDAEIKGIRSPLIEYVRERVYEWRSSGYDKVSETTSSLLNWWFDADGRQDSNGNTFEYYFAQREAVESIIYLYEIERITEKSVGECDPLLRELYEKWLRFVIKMATGSGKTKVISLVIAWSYFHKLYEINSPLSKDILLIAPNIIVLDRLRSDFEGNKIFNQDPVIPQEGYEHKNWRSDFRLQVHIQDKVGNISPDGNLFLTNIHRVFTNEKRQPSFADDNNIDYFLGSKVGSLNSLADMGEIVRKMDRLFIINDEAHHVHDEDLEWYKSIEDIHNHLRQKGSGISLQIDLSATPRNSNGELFKQTISDYPLVEAVYQNVVKRPVIPDIESQEKLVEYESDDYCTRYSDYLDLGVKEWRKTRIEHENLGKKAVLFIMADENDNCKRIREFLETSYPSDFPKQDGVNGDGTILVINTSEDGSIDGNNKIDVLRKAAKEIDNADNPYHAVVSVLMLREGWDVKNVTTIVGLRAFKSKVLPEQALGRGLRKMYKTGECEEERVCVIGTTAFIDFVRDIEREGVELERGNFKGGSGAIAPLVIKIDPTKDASKLDFEIPVLEKRYRVRSRKKSTSDILLGLELPHLNLPINQIDEQARRIKFRDALSDVESHETELILGSGNDKSRIATAIVESIMRKTNLVDYFDILYGKVQEFIQDGLFEGRVDIGDEAILLNLTEPSTMSALVDNIVNEINSFINTSIESTPKVLDRIRISEARPFGAKRRFIVKSDKTMFNYVKCDSGLEYDFAGSLNGWSDVVAYAKNYNSIGFRLDYQTEKGNLANYFPDFIIRNTSGIVYIVETKGLKDVDSIRKFDRLKLWCEDVNLAQEIRFVPLFVSEYKYREYDTKIKSFEVLVNIFSE